MRSNPGKCLAFKNLIPSSDYAALIQLGSRGNYDLGFLVSLADLVSFDGVGEIAQLVIAHSR